MKHKDFEAYPEKSVIKYTVAADGAYVPNLNLASVFRIVSTGYNLSISTPSNPRDGQYLRLEISSANAKTINFSTAFLVNGAVISDATHDANDVLVLDAWYDGDAAKWVSSIFSVKAA